MYLARYTTEEAALVQTLVQFGRVVVETADDASGWAAHFKVAVAALQAAPGVDVACRFHVCDRQLTRLWFLTAPQAQTARLEALCNQLFKLNLEVEDSVQPCLDRAQHDALAAAFPPLRRWMQVETYPYHGSQLLSDFSLRDYLEPILAMALRHGWEVALQFNLRRRRLGLDEMRVLRKNMVSLDYMRGLPGKVLDQQRRLVERTADGLFLVDGFIGTGDETAQHALTDLLGEAFAAEQGRLGFPEPAWTSGTLVTDLVESGLHASWLLPPTPLEMAAMALPAEAFVTLLAWQPPAAWAERGLANVAVVVGHERDYLRRIENKIDRLEQTLRSRNAALTECLELKKALGISRADPPFALAKARQILEGIIERIYRDQKTGQPLKPLFNMIETLLDNGRVFPRRVASYLHTLRVLGNVVAHGGPLKEEDEYQRLSEGDVELTLLMTLYLVEWYVFEYEPPGRAQAAAS